ncbi:ion channel [Halioxenophilus aromaticivorans]|uniref:Potassium channel family protein n=1 Tax=Halioxenophilus aromaticivorans TaxID=1306992 RepID=A0AAV3TXA7_9ALTE
MLLVFLINALVAALAVIIHYQALRLLTVQLPKLSIHPQLIVAFGVLGSMVAHLLEIWLFAVVYFLLLKAGGFGHLDGNFDGSLVACAYFSISAYTSLGLGDIEPFGLVRFVTGMEALTGLLLITWSASFMFLEMQRYWNKSHSAGRPNHKEKDRDS